MRKAWLLLSLGLLGCDRLERETTDKLDDPEPSIWTSRADCESVLPDQKAQGTSPRIGTWNIRFFPDSQEEPQTEEDNTTDVPWLACAIASLDVDVLAIQEFKTTELSLEKQAGLVARLNELTSGDWKIELATCEPKEVQHPGFLWDASRATGSNFRELPAMNPDATCTNDASPGFGAYFQMPDGPDFHLIAIHFPSGSDMTALDRRTQAAATMQAVATEAQVFAADTDVFFAGDFNTAGCDDCDPVISSPDEVATLSETVSQMLTPSTLLPHSEACTRQVDTDPPLLDHLVVPEASLEVPAGSITHVGGLCEALKCERLTDSYEEAWERLSDHCPVTLELTAEDAD